MPANEEFVARNGDGSIRAVFKRVRGEDFQFRPLLENEAGPVSP